jgi:hypothetical protein
MPVTDLFHERERLRLKGNEPEVYVYKLPHPLRVQLVHVFREVLTPYRSESGYARTHYPQNDVWTEIRDLLRKEFAVFSLYQNGVNPQHEIEEFFLQASDAEALSTLEAFFRIISKRFGASRIKSAVAEVNERVKKHAVGFEFDGATVIRVDSQYLHVEAVRPALLLLSQKGFEGANAEFLSAHEHYREGRHEEAMVDALKAFESAIKCIAKIRSIPIDPNATATPLIAAMVANKVLPASLESHLTGLRTALESGLPTLRNKTAGHGSGPEVREVPRHVAAHCLHLAAANIIFLVESHLAKK